MSMRDVIVTAMVDARHQWRAEGKEQSAWDDYNRFIADAVLAVLPLPSAEVIAAIDFAADGIGLDLEDPDTLPAYRVLAERHSAVLRAYLAALEDAE